MQATSDRLVVAPLLLRLGALLIDASIASVIGLGVIASIGDLEVTRRETYALLIGIVAAYNIVFLAWKSATPGKLLMGLYVADLEGRRLEPDKAILRYLIYFAGGAVLIGTLASIFLVVADPRRRAVHDRVAGTIVLFGRPPESQQQRNW